MFCREIERQMKKIPIIKNFFSPFGLVASLNNSTANYIVTFIEHGALPGSNAFCVLIKFHADP